MADIYGVAVGTDQPESASWTINTPAGLTGHRLVLALIVWPKSAVPSTPAGWSVRRTHVHSVADAAGYVYERALTAATLASTVTVTLGAAAQGQAACFAVDGEFDFSATPIETGWATTATPPAGIASAANSVLTSVVMSTRYPRTTTVAAPSIEILDHPGSVPPDRPSIHVSKKVVGAGTSAGDTFTFTDPYDGPGGPSTQSICFTLVYKPVASSPAPGPAPAPAPAAAFVGTPTGAAFAASDAPVVSVPGGAAGNTQILWIAIDASASVAVNTPSGFSSVITTPVDANLCRVYVFSRALTGTVATGNVTLGLTAACSGIAGAFTVAASLASSASNAASQSNYQTSVQSPALAAPAAGSLYISLVASGNYPRTHTPGGGIAEFIDITTPATIAVALGWETTGSSTYSPGAWTPADAFNPPPAAGGDQYRAIGLMFGPTGSTGGGGGGGSGPEFAVTAEGDAVYIAAPVSNTTNSITTNSAAPSWSDIAADENSYLVEYSGPSGAVQSVSAAANAQTVTLTGLLAGTTYTWTVTAIRNGDRSAPSLPKSFTTTVGADFSIAASSATVIAGERTTITVQTSPATVGTPITWSVSPAGILTTIGTPSSVTNGSGAGTISLEGTGAGATATVTVTVAGLTRTITITSTGLTETLVLTVSPSRFEKGLSTTATITGSAGGLTFVGRQIEITSSNPSVIAPATASTLIMQPNADGGGTLRVDLFAIANGTTTLQARVAVSVTGGEVQIGGQPLLIGGQPLIIGGTSLASALSNAIAVVVEQPVAPTDYTASGISMLAVTAETPWARARRANVRRVTASDLRARYPEDAGLDFADAIATGEFVFFRKALYK